jgi:hypothetical protein
MGSSWSDQCRVCYFFPPFASVTYSPPFASVDYSPPHLFFEFFDIIRRQYSPPISSETSAFLLLPSLTNVRAGRPQECRRDKAGSRRVSRHCEFKFTPHEQHLNFCPNVPPQ